MKFLIPLSALLVASTQAAPAIVWTKDNTQGAQHTSEALPASTLVGSVVGRQLVEASLDSVIFVVGRDADGKEALSRLAGEGALPGVQSKMGSALVHHHVENVESSIKLAKLAGEGAVDASMEEYNRKLAGEEGKNKKKNRALSKARVLVVNVSPKDSEKLDAAVTNAIENSSVGSVILTAQRSTEEVKRERKLLVAKQNDIVKASAGRRRLEDANQYYAYQAADNDVSGIYYVAITPNILSGVMFFFFFAAVTYTGVSCMGMIQGQDVYADKYPVIGREA